MEIILRIKTIKEQSVSISFPQVLMAHSSFLDTEYSSTSIPSHRHISNNSSISVDSSRILPLAQSRRIPYTTTPPQHNSFLPPTDSEKRLFTQNVKTGIFFHNLETVPVNVKPQTYREKISSFSDLDLGPALNRNVYLSNYSLPTPIQQYSIPAIIEGRDVFSCARNGSGKTVAYLLPIIYNVLTNRNRVQKRVIHTNTVAFPVALIIVPTRELCVQIFMESLKLANRTDAIACIACGGKDIEQQTDSLLAHGADIIIATPGRLLDLIKRNTISLQNVQTICLDEADKLFQVSFVQDIYSILNTHELARNTNRQTLLFSATYPQSKDQMISLLRNPISIIAGEISSTTEDIKQYFEFIDSPDTDSKAVKPFERNYGTLSNISTFHEDYRAFTLLVTVLDQVAQLHVTEGLNLVLIFVETIEQSETISNSLNEIGYPSRYVHAKLSQLEREDILSRFRIGLIPILVATDLFARGLDISGLNTVINFNLPHTFDIYVHRIGRTGRIGNEGQSITLIKSSDSRHKETLEGVIRLLKDTSQEVPPFLESMLGSASTTNPSTSSHLHNKPKRNRNNQKNQNNQTTQNNMFVYRPQRTSSAPADNEHSHTIPYNHSYHTPLNQATVSQTTHTLSETNYSSQFSYSSSSTSIGNAFQPPFSLPPPPTPVHNIPAFSPLIPQLTNLPPPPSLPQPASSSGGESVNNSSSYTFVYPRDVLR